MDGLQKKNSEDKPVALTENLEFVSGVEVPSREEVSTPSLKF